MKIKKKTVVKVMAFALGLLSVAAGIPKLLQMPQELGFLASIGLAGIAVSILGAVQFAGGLMLFFSRSRLAGAVLAGLTLLTSSVAIFAGGNSTFGLISLLPALVAGIVVFLELNGGKQDAASQGTPSQQ